VPLLGAYSDAGATATDNCDGDLSGDMSVVSTVDTSTLGAYAVDFSVEDAQGNEGNASRVVVVVAEDTTVIDITETDVEQSCGTAQP